MRNAASHESNADIIQAGNEYTIGPNSIPNHAAAFPGANDRSRAMFTSSKHCLTTSAVVERNRPPAVFVQIVLGTRAPVDQRRHRIADRNGTALNSRRACCGHNSQQGEGR